MIVTRLGPYEITAKLGSGRMREAYRAMDTRLDRQVAIKLLPEAFTADPERLARFEREAKVLAQRLLGGPVSVDESLVIARQIAEALEAAHEKGIVHRNLKPANVNVMADGRVRCPTSDWRRSTGRTS